MTQEQKNRQIENDEQERHARPRLVQKAAVRVLEELPSHLLPLSSRRVLDRVKKNVELMRALYFRDRNLD